jgi:hypothetical protein
VSKTKKDRSKSKVKEPAANTHTDSGNAPRAARSGPDSGRGGRGRGSERARGGRGRGAAAVQTNGTHTKPAAPLSVPTDQSIVWNASTKEVASDDAKPAAESWGGATDIAKAVVSTVIPDGKRTWASMFKVEPAPKPTKEPAPAEK